MRRALLLVVVLGSAPVWGQKPRALTSASSGDDARIARIEAGLLPRVLVEGTLAPQMRLADRMGHYRIPGVSIAVIDGGAVRWSRAYGFSNLSMAKPLTPRTRFQVGDASTLVTGVGALALIRQRQLDFDGDIGRWLRTWKLPQSPKLEQKKVTVRRLLSHSGGFGMPAAEGYDQEGDIPTLRQVLEGRAPATNEPLTVEYVPGTRTQYSAGGYAVLQQLMVDVTRTPFAALMQRRVLGPLKMANSTFEQPPPPKRISQLATGHDREGAVSGGWRVYPEQAAAGLWTTAEDLARFIVEVQSARAGRGKVLTEALAREYLMPGFGEMALGPRMFGRGEAARFTQVGQSAGFESVLVGYVTAGKGAVVLTNGEGGYPLAHEILLAIAQEYGWPGYAPRPAKRIEPEVLDAYAGRYLLEPLERDGRTLPPVEAETYVEGGQLFWRPEGLPPRPVYAEDAERFFALDGAPGVTFVRDVKGKVLGVVVQGGGLERRGKRVAATP